MPQATLNYISAVSPDPIIAAATKYQQYGQAELARIAHVNYVIDTVNSLITAVNADGYQGTRLAASVCPIATKDEYWIFSTAGQFATDGPLVEIGDELICTNNNTATGVWSVKGTNFVIIQKNMIPTTVAVLRTGTDNAAFVTAKTLADAGFTFASTTMATIAGGTTAQLGLTSTVAQKALVINATLETAASIVDTTVSIAASSCNVFSITGTMSTPLGGTNVVRGFYANMTSNAGDLTGSYITAHGCTMTSTALSQVNLICYRAVTTGIASSTAAAVIHGFSFVPNALTLNSATTTFRGINLDLTGVTNASSAGYYGIDIKQDLIGTASKAINITSTSAVTTATGGTITSSTIQQTMSGASTTNQIEVEQVILASNVEVGNWANALCAKIDFKTNGYAQGLAGVVCAELDMPSSAVPGGHGTYTCFEAEINMASASAVPISAMTVNVWGTGTTTFDTSGYIMDINGLTSGATSCFYSHNGTAGGDTTNAWLKIRVNGTPYWIGLYSATH